MVLPAASCADDISTDYCCSTLPDIVDRVRTVAWNGLCSCQDPACGDREFRTYSTIGATIQDPLGDSLIASMTQLNAVTGSTTAAGSLLPVGVYRATIVLELRDNGWPMIETDEMGDIITVPDWAMVNALAKHSLGHGERMYRALANAIQTHQMFTLPANSHIGKVTLSQLAPIDPTSFMVGWTCAVAVETTFP